MEKSSFLLFFPFFYYAVHNNRTNKFILYSKTSRKKIKTDKINHSEREKQEIRWEKRIIVVDWKRNPLERTLNIVKDTFGCFLGYLKISLSNNKEPSRTNPTILLPTNNRTFSYELEDILIIQFNILLSFSLSCASLVEEKKTLMHWLCKPRCKQELERRSYQRSFSYALKVLCGTH